MTATITITEKATAKKITIHAVSANFDDYYVTREGEDGPVFDTDEAEISEAIAAALNA